MRIRNERPQDIGAIRSLTQAAFADAPHSSGTEAAIVEALRDAGALTLSLVAVADGDPVGHVAFSPVTIGGSPGSWFGLGPVSVRPDLQRQGIGGALIREGLRRLREMGAGGCVVLGDPDYYQRFGFRREEALYYEGAPAAYFMALAMSGRIPAGAVEYHPAFEAS